MTDGCQWDGDCDHCGAHDCIASWRQAFQFYSREEAESRKRYGRQCVKNAIESQRKLEDWYRRAKWI